MLTPVEKSTKFSESSSSSTRSLASSTSSSSSSSISSLTMVVSKCFNSTGIMKLFAICCIYFVIFEYSVMSVDAIRCYQCNSNNNQSCNGLTLQSNQFLDDCKLSDNGLQPFCRKIALTIEYKDDHRIIRSCGYTPHINRTDHCITADNEGYLEQVCQCFTDGCNAAPATIKYYQNLGVLISILIIGLITSHLYYL